MCQIMVLVETGVCVLVLRGFFLIDTEMCTHLYNCTCVQMEARIDSREHSLPLFLEILFIHLSLCVCVCHSTCGGQGTPCGIPEMTLKSSSLASVSPWAENLSSLHHVSWNKVSHWIWRSQIWLSCLASKSLGSSTLSSPSTKLADLDH